MGTKYPWPLKGVHPYRRARPRRLDVPRRIPGLLAWWGSFSCGMSSLSEARSALWRDAVAAREAKDTNTKKRMDAYYFIMMSCDDRLFQMMMMIYDE